MPNPKIAVATRSETTTRSEIVLSGEDLITVLNELGCEVPTNASVSIDVPSWAVGGTMGIDHDYRVSVKWITTRVEV